MLATSPMDTYHWMTEDLPKNLGNPYRESKKSVTFPADFPLQKQKVSKMLLTSRQIKSWYLELPARSGEKRSL